MKDELPYHHRTEAVLLTRAEGSAWFSLEMTEFRLELETKVLPKIRNHGEGPY